MGEERGIGRGICQADRVFVAAIPPLLRSSFVSPSPNAGTSLRESALEK